jgi:hypothetical protein
MANINTHKDKRMKVMVLNETLVNALTAQNVPLESVADEDVFFKHLTHNDYSIVVLQTDHFIRQFEKRHREHSPLKGALCNWAEMVVSENSDIFGHLRETLTDGQIEDLVSDINPFLEKLACKMVDEKTALLYADPSSLEHGRDTLENIFCAMALIMPVNAVMKSQLYGHYVHSM